MVGSPCCPRDSQESSPAPQFESINSSALSLLYGPTLTFIYDCCLLWAKWPTSVTRKGVIRAVTQHWPWMPSARSGRLGPPGQLLGVPEVPKEFKSSWDHPQPGPSPSISCSKTSLHILKMSPAPHSSSLSTLPPPWSSPITFHLAVEPTFLGISPLVLLSSHPLEILLKINQIV